MKYIQMIIRFYYLKFQSTRCLQIRHKKSIPFVFWELVESSDKVHLRYLGDSWYLIVKDKRQVKLPI